MRGNQDDNIDRTEPDAGKRDAAHHMWELFSALRKEGFTEKQALTIIGQILTAMRGQS